MKLENTDYAVFAILIALIAVTGYNTYALTTTSTPAETGATDSILPTGVPETYGEELGVSFDDVSPYNQQLANQVIDKLANLDRSITLTESQNSRYINTLFTLEGGISCEYCCGARSIIFQNGKAACGCAHSFAMRGLAKYLITQHGDEYTDREILEEVGKWKTLFFPTQIKEKAKVLEEKGISTDYVTLTSNKYRGIEKGVTGGMVGGC